MGIGNVATNYLNTSKTLGELMDDSAWDGLEAVKGRGGPIEKDGKLEAFAHFDLILRAGVLAGEGELPGGLGVANLYAGLAVAVDINMRLRTPIPPVRTLFSPW